MLLLIGGLVDRVLECLALGLREVKAMQEDEDDAE